MIVEKTEKSEDTERLPSTADNNNLTVFPRRPDEKNSGKPMNHFTKKSLSKQEDLSEGSSNKASEAGQKASRTERPHRKEGRIHFDGAELLGFKKEPSSR